MIKENSDILCAQAKLTDSFMMEDKEEISKSDFLKFQSNMNNMMTTLNEHLKEQERTLTNANNCSFIIPSRTLQ